MNNYSTEQLQKIVDDAPEGAEHCFFDSSADDEKCIWYYKDNGNQSFDSGRWGFTCDPQSPRKLDDRLISLKDIHAELLARPKFKVGDRVVPESKAVNRADALREVLEVDGDQIKVKIEGRIFGYWVFSQGWRIATRDEEAAGHRIDEPSAVESIVEFIANPSNVQADTITAQPDPAKCHKVDPTLYDAPTSRRVGWIGCKGAIASDKEIFANVAIHNALHIPTDSPRDDSDAMSESHRSPSCKCHEWPLDVQIKSIAEDEGMGLNHEQAQIFVDQANEIFSLSGQVKSHGVKKIKKLKKRIAQLEKDCQFSELKAKDWAHKYWDSFIENTGLYCALQEVFAERAAEYEAEIERLKGDQAK